MNKKSEGKQVSYRPSDSIKEIFDEFCTGAASVTRGQLLEIAMRFLANQGKDQMQEIIMKFLLNQFPEPKKGERKKTA